MGGGFSAKAERVALMCGASWNEAQRGTNAIGTALIETNEVEIHGGEHFLERNGFALRGCTHHVGIRVVDGYSRYIG